MSRTKRNFSPVGYIGKRKGRDGSAGANKGVGYEYWSRRPGPISIGKKSKIICHRIERHTIGKKIVRKELQEAMN